MSKVRLKINMNTNGKDRSLSLIGIKTDNIIKYIDNDSHVEVNIDNRSININNNSYDMMLTFDINTVKILNYKLKQINKEMELNIKTNKLEVSANKFVVEYELLDNKEIVSKVYYELNMED